MADWGKVVAGRERERLRYRYRLFLSPIQKIKSR